MIAFPCSFVTFYCLVLRQCIWPVSGQPDMYQLSRPQGPSNMQQPSGPQGPPNMQQPPGNYEEMMNGPAGDRPDLFAPFETGGDPFGIPLYPSEMDDDRPPEMPAGYFQGPPSPGKFPGQPDYNNVAGPPPGYPQDPSFFPGRRAHRRRDKSLPNTQIEAVPANSSLANGALWGQMMNAIGELAKNRTAEVMKNQTQTEEERGHKKLEDKKDRVEKLKHDKRQEERGQGWKMEYGESDLKKEHVEKVTQSKGKTQTGHDETRGKRRDWNDRRREKKRKCGCRKRSGGRRMKQESTPIVVNSDEEETGRLSTFASKRTHSIVKTTTQPMIIKTTTLPTTLIRKRPTTTMTTITRRPTTTTTEATTTVVVRTIKQPTTTPRLISNLASTTIPPTTTPLFIPTRRQTTIPPTTTPSFIPYLIRTTLPSKINSFLIPNLIRTTIPPETTTTSLGELKKNIDEVENSAVTVRPKILKRRRKCKRKRKKSSRKALKRKFSVDEDYSERRKRNLFRVDFGDAGAEDEMKSLKSEDLALVMD